LPDSRHPLTPRWSREHPENPHFRTDRFIYCPLLSTTTHLPCRAHESAMGIFDMSIVGRPLPLILAVVAMLLEPHASARAFDVVLNAEGEFMDAYLVNGQAFPPKVVFID